MEWKFSTWGKQRAFTKGIEVLADKVAKGSGGKFTIRIGYAETVITSYSIHYTKLYDMSEIVFYDILFILKRLFHQATDFVLNDASCIPRVPAEKSPATKRESKRLPRSGLPEKTALNQYQ